MSDPLDIAESLATSIDVSRSSGPHAVVSLNVEYARLVAAALRECVNLRRWARTDVGSPARSELQKLETAEQAFDEALQALATPETPPPKGQRGQG